MSSRFPPLSLADGHRRQKRRETLRRITDAGICLFIEKGFDGATIDDIAAAAGISRRTFFHYFESKDDILLSLQSNMGDLVADEIRRAAPGVQPLAALRDAMIKTCAAIPSDDMIAIDRLTRGSPSVQARKQASYVQHEEAIFTALRERWPEAERAMGLRLVALMAVGAVRLSTEIFGREGGTRPLAQIMAGAFAAIEGELMPPAVGPLERGVAESSDRSPNGAGMTAPGRSPTRRQSRGD